MYFKAEQNKRNFDINVSETRDLWKVSIKEEDQDWKHFSIPKENYQYLDNTISFLFNKSSYLLDVVNKGVESTVYTRGSFRTIKIYNEEKLLHESLKAGGGFGSDTSLTAGMPGKIVKIMVKPGDQVKEGDPLVIMEAMKMENEMRATGDVKIKDIHVKEGDSVEGGALLITYDK